MAKKKDAAIMIAVGEPADEGGLDEETAPEEEGAYPEEGEEAPEEGEEIGEEGEGEGAYPEFSIPEGLDLSDLEPGEEKEVLCVIGKTSEGSACIKQVDGIDLAGEGQGMYGPPPAPPVPPPPPAGMAMGPPRGAPMPPPRGAPMMAGPGGPPPPVGPPGRPMLPPGMPMGPGGPVRARARTAGLM